MGLRSPVSSAKPTTSDEDTTLEKLSLIPSARSSKYRTRSSSIAALLISPSLWAQHAAERSLPQRPIPSCPNSEVTFPSGAASSAKRGHCPSDGKDEFLSKQAELSAE